MSLLITWYSMFTLASALFVAFVDLNFVIGVILLMSDTSVSKDA